VYFGPHRQWRAEIGSDAFSDTNSGFGRIGRIYESEEAYLAESQATALRGTLLLRIKDLLQSQPNEVLQQISDLLIEPKSP
jgi:hypothetical protein